MEQISLKATLRDTRGKQNAKKMREEGVVPGVVYHRGEEAVAISIDNREIAKIIHDAAGENLLINLTIDKEKKKSRATIIKEIQYDPVKRYILHVDFNEISLTEKITVEVEVIGRGEPIGVKMEGGVLDHPLRMIKIQCLPTDMPKHIDVDISGIKLNGTLHVRDLVISEKLKVLNDPDTLLFHVKTIVEPKAEEAGAETVAPELEVLREKKEEEKPGEKKEEPKKDAGKAEKK